MTKHKHATRKRAMVQPTTRPFVEIMYVDYENLAQYLKQGWRIAPTWTGSRVELWRDTNVGLEVSP